MTNVEPIVSADPAYYWCIGLYASGSTWLFNAGKKVAAAVGLLPGLASAYVVHQAELQFPAGTCNAIIKTHDTDGAAARTLARESQAIWLSLRDPKDCVASLITYHGCSFDEALEMTADTAQACLAVLDHPRAHLFRFEDNFFDAPATLDRIAESFGRNLASADRERIYSETRRSSIEAFIRRFPDIPTVVSQPEPGHFVDLDTQWHTFHAGRSGLVGRWRDTLTSKQVVATEQHLAEAMVRFGYPTAAS